MPIPYSLITSPVDVQGHCGFPRLWRAAQSRNQSGFGGARRRLFLCHKRTSLLRRPAWQEANVKLDEAGYTTPYAVISDSLRTQNSKARTAAAELIQEAFHLHAFDALTVSRSAADLTQLKEAIRSPRQRRYGQFKITYIEYDVVTWRILPSIENIRFEGSRAWMPGKALRYGPLAPGEAVLGLSHGAVDGLLGSLRTQTQQIWNHNPHSNSIPFRGIETPGLLAVARLALGDNPKIGVLDATDGFSRTVGAHALQVWVSKTYYSDFRMKRMRIACVKS